MVLEPDKVLILPQGKSHENLVNPKMFHEKFYECADWRSQTDLRLLINRDFMLFPWNLDSR